MNKLPMTILFSNFGTIEENNQPWANCQVLTDFVSDDNRSGCQVSKMPVSTENHFAVSKRLKMELDATQQPIQVMAVIGMSVVAGKTAMTLKDFELVTKK